MSTLQVDLIKPYLSSSVTIQGNVVQANAATTGSNTFVGNQIIQGNITASLTEGYAWVGNSSNVSSLVSTASFGGGAIDTSSFAILGANQIFTGNNTFTGNTVVSQSATFGTASFNGPVVISKGINSNVQITGSLISNKISVYDFDNLFYGSQMGGTTAQGTFFGYGSTDYTQTIGAYGGGFDNELQIYANNNGIEFRDFNQSGYPAWLKLAPNSGTNPAPAFVRGLDITGSLQHSGSLRHTGESYISGNIWVSGSVNLLNEGGNGWAFSSKAMFLTNSVQTGITVQSPIHFYKQTKGNMYITVNAEDAGSSGSMNLQVHNNQNLNISASSVVIDSDLYLDDNGGTTKFWINGNFDAEFLGTKTEWNEVANTLNVTAAEETVELVYNGWGGGYDNGYIVNVGSSGTQFQDWNTSYVNQTWLQIPVNNNNNPAPQFKRGLASTGSITIQSGSGDLYMYGHKMFNAGEFYSTTTQSGSAGVSGSITFNNSGSVNGVTLANNSRLTVTNAGTYNIQFSAQIETSAGADTAYLWFKKNGTNISDSATKVVLANNTAQVMTVNILDEANANDYYELGYQFTNGNASILAEVASGNIPAIPSVIATITQVR